VTVRWWWGTYPEAGLGSPTGTGEGLWSMAPEGSEASLVLEIPAPSFIVAHPDLPLLYAVTEEDGSTVACVSIEDPDHPKVVTSQPTGGSGACHVLLSRDTLTLYVSHYTSGEVAVVPLAADGNLASDAPLQVLPGRGSGPVPRRQEGPHAHCAGYAPESDTLVVADLGADELRCYGVLADGLLDPAGAVDLPAGSGPRHFATTGDLLYVVCELGHTLTTLRWDAAGGEGGLVASVPTTPVPLRSGSEICDAHVVAVGGVLLVSVRGADVISVFDLDAEGLPRYRAGFDSGGEYPRHFAVIGERLVVGNEKSHRASLFDLADVLSLEAPDDPSIPAGLPHRDVGIPSPACVCAA